MYKCTLCPKSYKTDDNLKKHVDSKHLGLKPFECTICDKKFTQKGSLTTHLKKKHSNNPNKYKCPQCDKSYADDYNVQRHVNAKHSKIKYKCSLCVKEFTRQTGLKKHIDEVHKGLKLYKCTECDETFSQRSNMRKHVNSVHKGIKPYRCTHCTYSCAEKHNLQSHINSHLGIKLYQCTKCKYSSTQRSHLNEHMLIHNSTYKFVCEDKKCGMLFKRKHEFKSHQKRRHKDGIVKYIKVDEERIAKLLMDNNIPFDYNVTIQLCDTEKKTARPDLIIQKNGCIIILEVDEHSHGNANLKPQDDDAEQLEKIMKKCSLNNYSIPCEQSRMTRILSSLKLGGEERPVGFIRYNPHGYTIDGIYSNLNKDEREKILLEVLDKWDQENDLKIQYMYYDTRTIGNTKRCCIWDHHDYETKLLEHCSEPIV